MFLIKDDSVRVASSEVLIKKLQAAGWKEAEEKEAKALIKKGSTKKPGKVSADEDPPDNPPDNTPAGDELPPGTGAS